MNQIIDTRQAAEAVKMGTILTVQHGTVTERFRYEVQVFLSDYVLRLYGTVNEGRATITLLLRRDGTLVKALFRREDWCGAAAAMGVGCTVTVGE